MAHIIYAPKSDGFGRQQIIINGHDFSHEIFKGVQLVEVGDNPMTSEVGLQVTFAVSRLDLGGDEDVQITDHFRSVAQRVHSTVEGDQ